MHLMYDLQRCNLMHLYGFALDDIWPEEEKEELNMLWPVNKTDHMQQGIGNVFA